MIVIIDTVACRTSVSEGDDLKRLAVSVRGQGDVGPALGTLGSGDADGQHFWLDIAALRQAAAPAGNAEWGAQFDAMIAYASRKGWVDASGTRVRVHLGAD